MHPDMNAYRCSIVRGGTSKGIFYMSNELPADPVERDNVILAAFGSPDIRQIDGLGGADVLTSKLAIIAPSASPDADVDYTFGQVSFERHFIDYNLANSLRAAGDVEYTMYVGVFSMVVFRLGSAYLFGVVLELGVIGVWIAMGMDWLARSVCFVRRYRREVWRTASVIAP